MFKVSSFLFEIKGYLATKMFNMNKWVSVLAVLVCLSAPSFSRSWVGVHDQEYNINDDHKAWIADPNDGPHHRPNHGWSPDFGSSEEQSWGSKDDYEDYAGHGYGNDRFDHFGYHHNHEGHKFDHHGDYQYHHYQGFNHQGHGRHNCDNKHDYYGHPSRSETTVSPNFDLRRNSKDKARGNQANPMISIRPLPRELTTESPQRPGLPQTEQSVEQFFRNNEDRVVFPDSEAPNFSTTRSPPPSLSNSAVTQASSTVSPSVALLDIVICIRTCPITPEFNPVCGTNNVTYNNLGALECTRNCGVKVALGRRAPCPQPLPPAFHISVPTLSTETPIVNARVGENNRSAPIAKRSASEQTVTPTTLPPAIVELASFTNIQTDSKKNLSKVNDDTKTTKNNNTGAKISIDKRINP